MTKPADERTAKLQERAMQRTEDFANCDPTLRKQFAEFAAAFAESERSSAMKEAANIRTQLLEVTAKVARGVYMPDIDNCRNIQEARAVIERADALRVGLAFELNKILKLLDGGER